MRFNPAPFDSPMNTADADSNLHGAGIEIHPRDSVEDNFVYASYIQRLLVARFTKLTHFSTP
jgi:hypothetical protein